uniref:Uncharacterized protein n=1 Tax=Anopheles dirus TaxID=7168 RepID=A0A182NIR6_9DIPT
MDVERGAEPNKEIPTNCIATLQLHHEQKRLAYGSKWIKAIKDKRRTRATIISHRTALGGSATANNHQLSSSSSSSSASPVAASSSTERKANGTSGLRLRAEPAQLVDNKIHDKLQQRAASAAGDDGRACGRQKREGIFSDNVLTNNYKDAGLEARITEEVLLVSNLTEERLREENDLLEHLNR